MDHRRTQPARLRLRRPGRLGDARGRRFRALREPSDYDTPITIKQVDPDTKAVLRTFPAMAVGNWVYHRTFYFSPAAFDNLFRLHLGFFDEIKFSRSVTGKRRVVAHCRVARS